MFKKLMKMVTKKFMAQATKDTSGYATYLDVWNNMNNGTAKSVLTEFFNVSDDITSVYNRVEVAIDRASKEKFIKIVYPDGQITEVYRDTSALSYAPHTKLAMLYRLHFRNDILDHYVSKYIKSDF